MRNVAFVLDNFRQMHVEQFDRLAAAMSGRGTVIGVELFTSSELYAFGTWRGKEFRHVNLFSGEERERIGMFRGARHIVRACRANGARTIFLSHYERPYIFLAALTLRLLGRRVLVLQDSKFDDRPRFLWKEVFKRLVYKPFQGAIVASRRSADYLRFLGINPENIRLNCYTTSIERVRSDAGVEPAPRGVPHRARSFVCVARLVPKKNHFTLLEAYSQYVGTASDPRRLVLCGSGPLEADIRTRIAELALEELVILKGNLSSPEVARELGSGLCLLLPSIEEQYGIVVIEAQALGLPVILTDQCGARDSQVRSGVDGFVVESDNPQGMAFFMRQLAEDEELWLNMSREAALSADKGDVDGFVRSALDLIGMRDGAADAEARTADGRIAAPR